MALQTMTIDPTVVSLTDNEIVDAVNNATTDISRADSITTGALAATAAKDNLDAMADTARGYIRTVPVSGQFPAIEIQRDSGGNLDVTYDDVAIV